ncbi:MAG: efflux RND transporter periplasmic adaptor subunit [Spirochaetes bacterium]|nr:efflux RND transporter periplasmic adaptor subunit [Spirochaetota bacterium]
MSKKRLVAIVALSALGIALVGGLAFWLLKDRFIVHNWIESPVVWGPFTDKIEVTGEVESRENIPVNAPKTPYERQLIELWEEGKRVQVGDIIARFDPAPVYTHMQALSNTILRLTNDYIASVLDFNIRIYNYAGEWSNAIERLKMYELSMETLRFESEFRKAVAEASYRQAKLDLDNAKRRIDQTKYQMDYLGRRRLGWIKQQWDYLARDVEWLKQYEVSAPIDSIAVYPLLTFGGMYRKAAIGDFMEYGREFMRLPAFSTSVVRLYLEERVINRVKPGTPARMRLRSYPDARLVGRVASVAGYAKEELLLKEKRTFEIVITVDGGKGVEHLKPGMTVWAELVLGEFPPVFRVPRDFVEEAEARYYVWVAGALRPVKHELKVDRETDDYFLVGPENAKGVFSKILPNRVAWFP